MTTTMSSSAALAVIEPAFSEAEKLALAGFLAGYCGLTREAYALDLRQFTAWCRQRQLRLFAVRRADIELFARDLETAGRARATVTRRLSTIAGLYKYAVEEDLLAQSPAAHVRRPQLDCESHATGLDRNEVGALLAAAGRGAAAEHAPLSLLALNGLRVSEATGADIEAPGRARAPDPGDHPQGRQESRHPARAAHRPGDRPGHRRALRGTHLRDRRRGTAGPARSRADSPPGRPPGRPGQENRPAHPAPRTHHSRPRRRRPAEGRAGSRLPRRPAHHHAPKRARVSLDRHATYIVSAYIAGAAR